MSFEDRLRLDFPVGRFLRHHGMVEIEVGGWVYPVLVPGWEPWTEGEQAEGIELIRSRVEPAR